jgi:leucyl aminopeptidase (aminopeptidase T)
MISATAPARIAAVEQTAASPASEQLQSATASWNGIAAPELAEARRFTTTPFERNETKAAPPRIDSLTESSLSLVTAEDRESATPHDFFEELADLLEQAAAEMGLGEE